MRDVTKFVKVVYRSNFVVRHWGDFLLTEASRKFQNGSSTLLKTRPRDGEVLEILVSYSFLNVNMAIIKELENLY